MQYNLMSKHRRKLHLVSRMPAPSNLEPPFGLLQFPGRLL
ncbi:hypothetical protein PAECIP111802_05426 [Paenibacillus allorhizosphaerae]|uniref:Uncharacterized protein n=1 Tax=Paenibacillus allorhizosphaerae TaxID=2849866 RepID=A0ABM8VPY6_9BACL|nr:hypothetical protein PAECIP111802_05426 [Paenibacillus allorhizosphaerae]